MSRIQQDLSSTGHGLNTKTMNGQLDNMLRRTLPHGRKLQVCVVGAGVAGLRSADVLLQHGAQVTIVEARDRIGGRVAQSDHLGHLVDLGANWIHGTADNPIMKLAAETKSVIHTSGEMQSVFNELGKRVSSSDAAETSEMFWSVVADAFKYSNDHSDSIPPSESLMGFFKRKAAENYNDDAPDEAKRKRNLLLQEAEMWGGFVGSPIERQSLKFFWLEQSIEGENPFVAETYQKILARIAQPALEKARIMLQHTVLSIESADAAENVTVEASNGFSETFDEVIVTVPLGYLKQKHTSIFHPPLPPRLTKAIDSIGYGRLDKVYLTFPSAFWDTPSPANDPHSDTTQQHAAPNTKATTAPLHDSTPPPTSHYPDFTQWLHPTYASTTNPAYWNQLSINLAALPASCAHPTLLFYIFGPCATHIASLVASTPTAALLPALSAFFHPYFSLLPNYSSTDPSCVPRAALATAWANDELAGYGSYSNFQVGLERGDEDIECMRHGMPERRVWLAGEHTAPFVALGTVTGAWWAGEGVGQRIAGVYGMGGQPAGLRDGGGP